MNELALELARRAGLKKEHGADREYIGDFEWRHFAQSIVRECIEQGKQVQSQNVSNGSKDYVDGREMGIEVFMNQIKKHFGVEE